MSADIAPPAEGCCAIVIAWPWCKWCKAVAWLEWFCVNGWNIGIPVLESVSAVRFTGNAVVWYKFAAD